MAEICCGVVSESEATTSCETSSRTARRRRMEIRRFKFVTGVVASDTEENERPKRQKLEAYPTSFSRDWENALENCVSDEGEMRDQQQTKVENGRSKRKDVVLPSESLSTLPLTTASLDPNSNPKYGVSSVCGRRRDMEDAVAVHPSFFRQNFETAADELHYFGVYDGHGCSHVSSKSKPQKKKNCNSLCKVENPLFILLLFFVNVDHFSELIFYFIFIEGGDEM